MYNTPDSKEHFRQLVQCIREGSTTVKYSHNHLPWQTRIVLNELIDYAKTETKKLRIFTGDVRSEFYGVDFLPRIIDLLKNGCEVTIVLAEKPSIKTSSDWLSLNNFGKVHIFFKKDYDENAFHIAISGDAYRFEKNHKKLPEGTKVKDESPKRPARFGFHCPEDVKVLDAYWNNYVIKDAVPLT